MIGAEENEAGVEGVKIQSIHLSETELAERCNDLPEHLELLLAGRLSR